MHKVTVCPTGFKITFPSGFKITLALNCDVSQKQLMLYCYKTCRSSANELNRTYNHQAYKAFPIQFIVVFVLNARTLLCFVAVKRLSTQLLSTVSTVLFLITSISFHVS